MDSVEWLVWGSQHINISTALVWWGLGSSYQAWACPIPAFFQGRPLLWDRRFLGGGGAYDRAWPELRTGSGLAALGLARAPDWFRTSRTHALRTGSGLPDWSQVISGLDAE